MGLGVELRGRALASIFKNQGTLRTVLHEGILIALIFQCLNRVVIAVLIQDLSGHIQGE